MATGLRKNRNGAMVGGENPTLFLVQKREIEDLTVGWIHQVVVS
jgi:hypothetical protein